MTVETVAELQALITKIDQVKTERNYLAEVYNGLREVSMTFYYNDKTGNKNFVNTFAFSPTFPFDIMNETKIMLRDAIEHYDEILSELRSQLDKL